MTKQKDNVMVRCSVAYEKYPEECGDCPHGKPHKGFDLSTGSTTTGLKCSDKVWGFDYCKGKCLPIPTKKKKVCEWRVIYVNHEGSRVYKIDCIGTRRFNLIDFKYCPYCGKKIALLKKEGK